MGDRARYQQIKAIFQALAEAPPDEREARLVAACGDDVALAAEVRSLLATDTESGGFLRPPGEDGVAVGSTLATLGSRSYEIVGELGRGGWARSTWRGGRMGSCGRRWR